MILELTKKSLTFCKLDMSFWNRNEDSLIIVINKAFVYISYKDKRIFTEQDAIIQYYLKNPDGVSFPHLDINLAKEYYKLKENIYLIEQKEKGGNLYIEAKSKEDFKNNEINWANNFHFHILKKDVDLEYIRAAVLVYSMKILDESDINNNINIYKTWIENGRIESISLRDMFKNDESYLKCLELMEDLEITLKGKCQLSKAKGGKLFALIDVLVSHKRLLLSEKPQLNRLLKYFNFHLGTDFKEVNKRSIEYAETLDDAVRLLRNY